MRNVIRKVSYLMRLTTAVEVARPTSGAPTEDSQSVTLKVAS